MSCLVKICGLQHVATVDVAVEAGADAVGFVFAKSVRQVTARHAAFSAASVPENVLRVPSSISTTMMLSLSGVMVPFTVCGILVFFLFYCSFRCLWLYFFFDPN